MDSQTLITKAIEILENDWRKYHETRRSKWMQAIPRYKYTFRGETRQAYCEEETPRMKYKSGTPVEIFYEKKSKRWRLLTAGMAAEGKVKRSVMAIVLFRYYTVNGIFKNRQMRVSIQGKSGVVGPNVSINL